MFGTKNRNLESASLKKQPCPYCVARKVKIFIHKREIIWMFHRLDVIAVLSISGTL